MHEEHTVRLETLDIFSHAAKMACNSLSGRPLGMLGSTRTSEAENEDDVRLMDGIEDGGDSTDNGEPRELGEPVSGDGDVCLAAAS
jgi:hypothetical protein